MWTVRHPSRRLRQRIVPLQNLFLAIGFLLCLESYIHRREFHVEGPSKPLDQPFSIGCRTPDANASRENAVIVMVARNSDRDGALKTVTSFERQFNQWFHYPMVFLNDQPWDQSFVNALAEVASGEIQFRMISKEMWGFPDWMDQNEARREMKKQADHGIMYAGAESYHHMCRFYSGWVP
jgi:mannosyltransferase